MLFSYITYVRKTHRATQNRLDNQRRAKRLFYFPKMSTLAYKHAVGNLCVD